MKIKVGFCLYICILLLILPGCDGQLPSSGQNSQALLFLNDLSDENPIDRAFARMAGEQGEEMESDTIFTYLYALKWHDEYNALYKLSNENSSETSWESYIYNGQLVDTASAYAREWTGSDNASEMFKGMARFYKLLAYDCISRLNERGDDVHMQTNEEELYRYLKDVDYAEYTPDDFEDFDIREAEQNIYKPAPVYAALPDENIRLAFAPPFGVILSVKDEKYFYRWSNGFLTPRGVLPRLSLFDYDGDEADELAVILYVGSGTGVEIEELHIVELYDGMRDYPVTSEEIESLLFHRLSASYDSESNKVTVKLDDQTILVDTSRVEKKEEKYFQGLDLHDLIGFSADNSVLSVHIIIGLCGFDYATAFDYVDFYADLIWKESGYIALANCRINK